MINHPVSLLCSSKVNELITLIVIYGIACTGLRFFTVYGPWGRPDGSNDFADAIINKKILRIFNYGKMSRSFTFIDDVIEIIIIDNDDSNNLFNSKSSIIELSAHKFSMLDDKIQLTIY